jgi:hypothetical protein
MTQTYVVVKRISISQEKVVIVKGDTLVFKPANNNSLTVYRGGQIFATFPHTQLGINALERDGIIQQIAAESPIPDPTEITHTEVTEVKGKVEAPVIVAPVIEVPTGTTVAPPVELITSELVPPATIIEPVPPIVVAEPVPTEGATEAKIIDPTEASSQPSDTTGESSDNDDVSKQDEKPGDITTYTKEDLIKYAEDNKIVVNPAQGQRKLLAAIQAELEVRATSSSTEATTTESTT